MRFCWRFQPRNSIREASEYGLELLEDAKPFPIQNDLDYLAQPALGAEANINGSKSVWCEAAALADSAMWRKPLKSPYPIPYGLLRLTDALGELFLDVASQPINDGPGCVEAVE